LFDDLGAGGGLLVMESNRGVVVSLVHLGGLEDQLVDQGGSNSTEDGSEPVDPVVVPGSEDDGGAKGASGVHAGAGERDSEEMAGGDGESDGKRSGALHAGSVVVVSSSSEHDPDEHEGDEELDAKGLSDGEVFVDGGHAEASSAANVLRSQDLEQASTNESAKALEHDVEERLEDADLPAEDEAEGHGRVDVAAGDVADGLGNGGDGHAEGEGDADDVRRVAAHAGAAADEDEEHGAQELGGQALEDVDDLAAELVDSDVGKK